MYRFQSTTIIPTLLWMACGCAGQNSIHRKNVADLYQEAVQIASERSEPADFVGLPSASPILPIEHFEVGRDMLSPVPATSGNSIADVEADTDDNTDQFPIKVVRAINGIDSSADLVPYSEIKRLNDSFDTTEIREAINILAESAGVEVVFDDRVTGDVTAEIKEKTFEEALEIILLPHGLVWGKHNGKYLIVDPLHPNGSLFRYVAKRYHYPPRHHLATKLVELIPQELTKYYQLSDQRNLIVVNAPPSIAEEVLTRLQELDQPVPQVILEAIVCVTTPDSGFRFGMDWNHVLTVNSSDQLKVGLSGLAFSAAASRYGVSHAFDDFAVTSTFVQLLCQQGYVTIRAQPRVTAKHGEQAAISINRETFFSLQPNNSNLLFRQDVQKVDAGITLMITPRIRGNIVSVDIERAEVSEDIRSGDSRSELTANPYPIINRRQVSTQVDVPDGSTIVLGGLVQRQTVDRISRTPGLSSLPLIGNVFQKVEKQEQDTEVAIFISPRIVQPVSEWYQE